MQRFVYIIVAVMDFSGQHFFYIIVAVMDFSMQRFIYISGFLLLCLLTAFYYSIFNFFFLPEILLG
jgi:hypothetical protein